MGPFALVSVLLTASAADRLAFYADADADGYGDPSTVRYATGPTAGYTRQGGDCDDTDARVHPAAVELCNDRDEDCDGLNRRDPDVVGGSIWYADLDLDGFGDPRARMRSCVQPNGYVDIAEDCDDGDDEANPLAFEFCGDGDDDDCDGYVDECDVSLDDAALVVETGPSGGPLVVADMDGDGTGDLVAGSYAFATAVHLLYGPVSGEILIDDAVSIDTTSTDDGFGSAIGGGDADGDGFDDLLVGAADISPSVTYVFLGPVTADRDASDADAMLTNVSERDYKNLAVIVMSDHDGDGAADIAVGSADDDSDSDLWDGAVYVAPGGTLGTLALDSDATYTYVGDGVDFVGEAVADLGDVSGDGISDLAIGAPYVSGGTVFIVDGGSSPGRYLASDVASAKVTGHYQMGRRLQAIDYDGDGSVDLLAEDDPTVTGSVRAFLGPFVGSLDVTDATASWEWTSADGSPSVGQQFAAADFDGDGETDLIIGAPGNYYGNYSGAVFFQWGVASGLVDVGSLPYVTGSFGAGGSFEGARLGGAVTALPDWNGDGIPEVAILSEYGPGFTDGTIYGLFSGSY